MNEPVSIAVCGNGKIDPRNLKKLIEFWFFGDVVLMFPHDFDEKIMNVFREVLPETPMFLVDDVIQELAEENAGGRDIEFAVLWDNPDEDTKLLVKKARELDVPVRNLCHALDDLIEDQEASSIPEPPLAEPESKSETVKPASRTPRRETKTRNSPAVSEPPEDRLSELEAEIAHYEREIRRVRKEIDSMTHGRPAPGVKAQEIRPPKPAEPDTTGKKAYITDGNGGIKPRGRGRPRADEQVVWLTEAEAAARGVKK